MCEDPQYTSFYDERRSLNYGDAFTTAPAEERAGYKELRAFIDKYELRKARCLEIGSSGGGFQDMVEDYYGTDISQSLAVHYHKPYRVCADGKFPFPDEMFDAIWTINTFEHIPQLQTALLELKRLLKPGGVLFFQPAWQCRPWAAQGYPVRPFSDFGLWGKLIKMSVPLRNSVLWRACFIMPKRLVRAIAHLLGHQFDTIKYKKLRPNYENYWMSDSDACNSIDPHDAILWFVSNGFECLSNPTFLKTLLVRTGSLVLRRKPRSNKGEVSVCIH